MSVYTKVYLIYGVGLFLAAVFFAQRVYTKLKILGSFVVEDWMLTGAFVLSIGTQVIGLRLFVDRVAGSHTTELLPWQRDEFAVSMVLAPIVYAPATCLAKLSLLFFYLRITPQLWFLRTTKVLIWIVVVYSVGITLSNLLACRPIQASWDPSITDKTCINTSALYIATAALNIATDIMMLVLPIPVVVPLQMSKRQKTEIVGIFTLGSLTFITSIVRLVYLLPMLFSSDASWQATCPVVWIGIEANLQIICASAPTLRKFLRTALPRFFDSHPGGDGTATALRRENESLGLRTFGQAPSHLVDKTAATVKPPQRPPTTLRGADDIEATLVHFDSQSLASRRFSLSSHEQDYHEADAHHPSRLVIRHDPKLTSPAISDCGSERAMLGTSSRPSSHE